LIPHESIIGNVELTMKLSGATKFQRRARAIAVLQKVSLCDEHNKKPSSLHLLEVVV